MILKKGQPIGCTDSVFHDICVGDEIVDSQGRHYTVTPYGAAKPLSGPGEIDIKHLKDVTVVIDPGDANAAAISAQVEKAPEKPAQAAQISTQTEKPGKDTTQGAKAAKRPAFKPHKDNGSGLVDLSNLKRNLPGHTAATLFALAVRLGIPIVLHAGRRAVSTADAVRLADEAMKGKATEAPKKQKRPANDCRSFDLVRDVKTGREFLAEYSSEAAEWYEKGTGKAHSIPSVEIVKVAAERTKSPAKRTESPEKRTKPGAKRTKTEEKVSEAVRKRIALQALDDRELIPDDLLLSVTMKRDLVPDEGDVTTLSDQALADELRHRGYTVTAVKHFEL